MNNDLYKIMYISSATQNMSNEELDTMMAKCREKNAFFNITGYMIYHQGKIIQLLEGKRNTVEYIYNTIRLDNRHQDVIELCKSSVERRTFAECKMGFQNIDREQIQKVNTLEDLFFEALTPSQLNQICNRAGLFFETFIKIARLGNYRLLQSRMLTL